MSSRVVRAAFLSWVVLASALVGVTLGAGGAGAAYPGGDGRIAFVRANQIYTMTAAGTDVQQLTTAGKNYRPKWSPDGRRISFVHEVSGQRDVWVMGARGGHKTAVTRSGDITSAGASWSPNGKRLAFAASSLLVRTRSTAPFGSPTALEGLPTGGFCDGDGQLGPVLVDRFVAWAPGDGGVAVLDHADCYFDDRIDTYFPATQELRQYAVSGGDCCGYLDWTDLFWGPGGALGYSERDLGDYGEDVDAPSRIVYPGFASLDGDTGGAPSPAGTYLALTNASSGTARVVRANADGTGRVVLARGYQPDWQPLP